MVTNKEHPHNELSKEEVELKIEELVKKIQNDYEKIFDKLSPATQANWYAVLKDVRFSKDRESAFNYLHALIKIIDLEAQKLEK